MILNVRVVALVACLAALAACGETQIEAPAPEAAPEAAAPITPAFVGTWAADAAGCALPQEAQGAPYIFNADGFDQHEAHCTFATLDETSPNTWRANAACQVEGDEQSVAWDMSVEGDTMTMRGQRLMRCPEDPPMP
jgi:hypothetical protein